MVHLSDNSEEEALLTYRLQREPRSSMYARLKAWKAHPFWLGIFFTVYSFNDVATFQAHSHRPDVFHVCAYRPVFVFVRI